MSTNKPIDFVSVAEVLSKHDKLDGIGGSIYLANLASLPEAQKNALLYGDWDTFSGQVFTEWKIKTNLSYFGRFF